MISLSDAILEFNPNALEDVRKEFDLDKPGRMDEAIDILEDWVKKQSHFSKKDFTREYLERTLISTKGRVERAKTRLDKLCTFKTLMPNFFKNTDTAKIYDDIKGMVLHAHLPKQTSDHHRIHFSKILADVEDASQIYNYYKYIIVLSEYIKRHDYSNGFILVMDFSNVNIMSFVTKMNVIELRQAMTLLMEGYGMRVKGIHYITQSKMIDAMVSLFKQVLSEKLSNRIHVHKTVETFYDFVPRDILPAEYGGKEKSLKALNEEWFKILNGEDFQKYLREMNEAKTDESCRQADKFNESYIGMPGSFRSLSVD